MTTHERNKRRALIVRRAASMRRSQSMTAYWERKRGERADAIEEDDVLAHDALLDELPDV